MGVVDVKEDGTLRNAVRDIRGDTAVRRFTVVLDETAAFNDRSLEARLATGIPRAGDAHPDDAFLFCQRVDPTNMGSSTCAFYVTCSYGRPVFPSGGNGDGENPLDEPADIRWESAKTVESVDIDADGNPIVNVVDEGFDPPVTRDFDDEMLIITRNEATFTADTIREYKNTVNEVEFYGADPGTGRITSIMAQRVVQGGSVIFWRVTYVIQFRQGIELQPDGSGGPAKAWYERRLNEGFRELITTDVDGTKHYEVVLDDNEIPLNNPVPLDANGLRHKDGDPYVWLEFKIYEPKDWTPLGLE